MHLSSVMLCISKRTIYPTWSHVETWFYPLRVHWIVESRSGLKKSHFRKLLKLKARLFNKLFFFLSNHPGTCVKKINTDNFVCWGRILKANVSFLCFRRVGSVINTCESTREIPNCTSVWKHQERRRRRIVIMCTEVSQF